MRVVVSIIGLPGAGKSTVARELAQLLGVPALSTGEALRRIAQDDVRLAKDLAAGRLGPEGVVQQIVDEFIGRNPVAVLDGYPRHRDQAAILLRKARRVVLAHLEIDSAVAFARIRQRALRGDDNEAAIRSRMTRDATALADVLAILAASVSKHDATQAPIEIARQIIQSNGLQP